MLCKWMVCDVLELQKNAFSTAQKQWIKIQGAPGFLGQWGGWDKRNPTNACIMGLWKKESDYQHFMNDLHDHITDDNQQASTYKSLQVSFFQEYMPIPGHKGVTSADRPTYIRIAECFVKADRVEHFIQTQKELWNPGMSQVEGMLGGHFCRHVDEPLHFLVISFWKEELSHKDYVENVFPELRKHSHVDEELNHLIGRFIALESAWDVPATKNQT